MRLVLLIAHGRLTSFNGNHSAQHVTLGPGAMIGLTCSLEGEPAAVSVTADTDALLWAADAHALRAVARMSRLTSEKRGGWLCMECNGCRMERWQNRSTWRSTQDRERLIDSWIHI